MKTLLKSTVPGVYILALKGAKTESHLMRVRVRLTGVCTLHWPYLIAEARRVGLESAPRNLFATLDPRLAANLQVVSVAP